MRLFELKGKADSLPKELCGLKVKWDDPSLKDLYLTTNNTLILRPSTSYEIFFLSDGLQFLLVQDYDGVATQIYFGGTDDGKKFFVRLREDAIDFIEQGEKVFYEALIPRGVREYEKRFGTRAVRQGGWCAVPFPAGRTFGDLSFYSELFGSGEIRDASKSGYFLETYSSPEWGRLTVEKTGHKLFGKYTKKVTEDEIVIIGEGILRNANRKDLKLKGLHIFFYSELVMVETSTPFSMF